MRLRTCTKNRGSNAHGTGRVSDDYLSDQLFAFLSRDGEKKKQRKSGKKEEKNKGNWCSCNASLLLSRH